MIEPILIIAAISFSIFWMIYKDFKDMREKRGSLLEGDDEENYGIPSAKPVTFGHHFTVKDITEQSWCHVMEVKDSDGMDIYPHILTPVKREYIQGLYSDLRERGGYTSAFSLNTAVTMAREATAREKRGQPLPESRASLQDELPPSAGPNLVGPVSYPKPDSWVGL